MKKSNTAAKTATQNAGDEAEKGLVVSSTTVGTIEESPPTQTETGDLSVRETGEIAMIAPQSAAYDADDLATPWLKLAHPQSSGDATPGEFVLDGRVTIYSEGSEPLAITALTGSKFYTEDVEYNSGQVAKTYFDEAEVHNLGFTTEYGNDHQKPDYHKTHDWHLLVKKPDGLGDEGDDLFLFPGPDGAAYCMAKMRNMKTAYTHMAKNIITARKNGKWPNWWRAPFSLISVFKTGKNDYWHPLARRMGDHDPKFQKWAESLAKELG